MNNLAIIGFDLFGNRLSKQVENKLGDTVTCFSEEEAIKNPLQFTRYEAVIFVCSLGDEQSSLLADVEKIKKHQRKLIFLGTTPFKWEGSKKSEIATEQRDAILSMITCAKTIDYNDFAAFIKKQGQPRTATDAFSKIDDVMIESIQRIAELSQFDAAAVTTILQEEMNVFQIN